MKEFENSDVLPESAGISISTLPTLAAKGLWRGQTACAVTAHRFYWVTRGQSRASILAATRGYAAQMLIYVPAGVVAALPVAPQMQGYALTVPDNLPVPVPAFPAMIRAMRVADQAQITAFFDQIVQEVRLPQSGSDHVIESQVTLLSVWIERRQSRNEFYGMDDRAGRLAEAFLQRLEQEFRRDHKVAAYAAALEITPTHLSRICRDILGRPASELIADRLMLEARRQLADGSAAIGRLATALGFANVAHFSRFFSLHADQSPRAFRKAAQSGIQPGLLAGTRSRTAPARQAVPRKDAGSGRR
ncbi:MAG: AraC family transcriptional regulator [Rhodobacteraceae bacterium]|nr:AraC family transcriptional regulator [Paracoccaceae bacterium]